MDLKFNLNEEQDLLVIELKGDFDITNSSELVDLVKDKLEKRIKNVLIDLSQLQFIDSSGLGSLVRISSSVRKKEGRLAMVKPKEDLFELFRITRLNNFFHFFNSIKEAKDFLNVP